MLRLAQFLGGVGNLKLQLVGADGVGSRVRRRVALYLGKLLPQRGESRCRGIDRSLGGVDRHLSFGLGLLK